jgi:hypothetical protein
VPPCAVAAERRVGIGQRPLLELPIQPRHDSPELGTRRWRQHPDNVMQTVPRLDRTAARAVVFRVENAARASQKACISGHRSRDGAGPEPFGLQATYGAGRPSAHAVHLTEVPRRATGRETRGAHRARPPTRHRPFGSRSWPHHGISLTRADDCAAALRSSVSRDRMSVPAICWMLSGGSRRHEGTAPTAVPCDQDRSPAPALARRHQSDVTPHPATAAAAEEWKP